MDFIIEVAKALLQIIWVTLVNLAPFLIPVLLVVAALTVFKKYWLVTLVIPTIISSFFNIIICLFPNQTTRLAAGNTILSMASIESFFDIILTVEMTRWGIYADFVAVIVGVIIVFLCLRNKE